MDEYCLIKRSTLDKIGNAIRVKTGKIDKMSADIMPSEILSITGGGTVIEEVTAIKPCMEVLEFNDNDYVVLGTPHTVRLSPLTSSGTLYGEEVTYCDFPVGFLSIAITDTYIREDCAFKDLKIVEIPRGDTLVKHVIRIPEKMFHGLAATDINIELDADQGDYIREVGDYAFYKTTKLNTPIDLSNTGSIGSYAFAYSNSPIGDMKPTAGTGEYAFAYSNIRASVLAAGGAYAYTECLYLPETVSIGDSLNHQEGVFMGCRNLKKVIITERYVDISSPISETVFADTPIGEKASGTGVYVWQGGEYYISFWEYYDLNPHLNIYGWLILDGEYGRTRFPAETDIKWYSDIDFTTEVSEQELIEPVYGKRYYCKKI